MILVYRRLDEHADEPLFSVVMDESLAREIEQDNPEFDVRWETVPWHRQRKEGDVSLPVYIVMSGLETSPVGLVAFDHADAAVRAWQTRVEASHIRKEGIRKTR